MTQETTLIFNEEWTKEGVLIKDLEDLIRHGIIVSRIASLVSRELGLSEEDIYCMSLAGLLHDIGKLRIGKYLYGRNVTDLKVEEVKYVRRHSVLGYEILKKEGYRDIILQAVKHHHENYDGSGYPDNLKGEDIPFSARILRVCDVFSALVENRPYRKAFSIEQTIQLLIAEVKNFDMKCFLALQKVVHSKGFEEVAELIQNNNLATMDLDHERSDMNLDLW